MAFGLQSATAAPVAAKQSDSFVESIGVNVHLSYTDSQYNNFPRVSQALQELGVRYVRDGVGLGMSTTYSRYRALAEEGIKLDFVVGDPLQRWGIGSLSQQLEMIEREFPQAVATLEGPNEFDIQGDSNWVSDLRNYQRALWEGVQQHPLLASKPILGPSLVRESSRYELGDISQWVSQGNMHPYPGGQMPDADQHSLSELHLASVNTGSLPVEATETGYQNAINNRTAGNRPTSEKAAGIYTPRLFLDNFRRGIVRTYDYELLDLYPDPSKTSEYKNFGLLQNNWTPKPSYTALQRLISLTADPGPSFVPESLAFTVQNAPSTERQVLLERRDGSFDLVLWNAVSVWNTESLTEINPPSPTVTVNFEQPVEKAEVFMPNESASPIATVSGTQSLPISLSPSVTVIHLSLSTPTIPVPGPPAPLEPNTAGPALPPSPPVAPTPVSTVKPVAPTPAPTEVLSVPPHELSPARLHSILRSIRNGCVKGCPLRSDEVVRAQPLLRQRADLAAGPDAGNREKLGRWLYQRAQQIRREATHGGWGVDRREVRYLTIMAVLRLAKVLPGSQ